LTIGKIIKIAATRSYILKLICTKMHQIQFRLGLRLRPHWGSLQRSTAPLSWI